MLRLLHRSKRPVSGSDRYEQVFLARHNQLVKWAHQLSSDSASEAEDLIQDAFIQFLTVKPDLDKIQNLDAYLYSILRNLRRSALHRNMRLRQVPLSILDFDSAADGLRVIAGDRFREVREDLAALAEFACQRKETSRIGSLLILRFFLGYNIQNTAALMMTSRGAVDEQIRRARKEAREFLVTRAAVASGRLIMLETEVKHEASLHLNEFEDAVESLRRYIFSTGRGECLATARIRRIYSHSLNEELSHSTLAHIVSCVRCLHLAARCLRLDQIDDSSSSGPGAPADKHDLKITSTDKRCRIHKWKQQLQRTLEHRPNELRVTVNGLPLVSQNITVGRNELSISVPLHERIDFVEVLSEQEIRLLMLPIEAQPPEGEFEQHAQIDLSDGRTLAIHLTFDDPWPTVRVEYQEPQASLMLTPEKEWQRTLVGTYLPEVRKAQSIRQALFAVWTSHFWAPALAVLLIIALLFVQTRDTTANAAVLIQQMEGREREATPTGNVLHRTFDLIERSKRSSDHPRANRRVEVWRKVETGVKVSKLFDHSGALLKSVRLEGPLPALTPENAWEFEPAPDTFRALAGDLTHAYTWQVHGKIELSANGVRLAIDRGTLRPLSETIDTPDAEFRFVEISSGSVPEALSPLTTLSPRPIGASISTPARETRKAVPVSPMPRVSRAELDQYEVAARVALHRLSADVGEEIHIHRSEQEIEITGVLDSIKRKEEIQTALEDLPHVRPVLLAPEDLANPQSDSSRTFAVLQTKPQPSTVLPALLTEWLEEHYPNENERRAYVSRVLDLSRQRLGRAYALKELSDRYGVALPRLVEKLFDDHFAAVQNLTSQINDLLAPAVLTRVDAMSGEPMTAAAMLPRPETVTRLFDDLNGLDRSLLRLFAPSLNSNSVALGAELRNYWHLRHDAAAQISTLTQH